VGKLAAKITNAALQAGCNFILDTSTLFLDSIYRLATPHCDIRVSEDSDIVEPAYTVCGLSIDIARTLVDHLRKPSDG